jgi:PA14 domain
MFMNSLCRLPIFLAFTLMVRPSLQVLDAPADGTGLTAEYFQTTLTGQRLVVRNDPAVNFDWGYASPAPVVPVDTFAVRWTGRLLPQASEATTIYATVDDGMRVWVGGTLVIDRWQDQSATTVSSVVNMTAGQAVDLRVEYYEAHGSASARLDHAAFPRAVHADSTDGGDHDRSLQPERAPRVDRSWRSSGGFVRRHAP